MLVAAIGAGLVIGLSLGALGGGGSILTVPALVYLLGESAHQATATSLLVVGTAALAGAPATPARDASGSGRAPSSGPWGSPGPTRDPRPAPRFRLACSWPASAR